MIKERNRKRNIARLSVFFLLFLAVPIALITINDAEGNRLVGKRAAIETYSYPVLPAVADNYANIPLPNHFLVNGFPGNVPGQNAVIDNDNTPVDNPTTDAGAALGRVLFYDKRLSANSTTACASCHKQEFAFTDNASLSVGFDGGTTRRHSMSLSNVRFYEAGKMFWDERAMTLEAQALMPIQDTVEMGLTLAGLEHIVQHQPYYPALFTAAFGDATINSDRIAKAIAQFERSMVSATSKYDTGRALVSSPLDPFPNFTMQENHGKDIFMKPEVTQNPIACIACHMSEGFLTPARFDMNPNITTDATNVGTDIATTDDAGVMETTGNPMDDFKFKVPSLRNIGVGAPYMHDGRFSTLDELVTFYSNGIQPHPNLDPRLRLPGGMPLHFNFDPMERDALIAFMHTLTDTQLITASKYSSPFISTTEGLGRKFLDGVAAAGTLDDTCNSDDDLWELDPSPTKNPFKQKIDLIVQSESPVATPTTFKLLLESTVIGGPGEEVALQIQFWNQNTNDWESLGNYDSPDEEQFIEVNPTGDVTRFIHPITSEITARVTWKTPSFTKAPFFWSVDVNTLVWVID